MHFVISLLLTSPPDLGCHCAGFGLKGADLQGIVCRTAMPGSDEPAAAIMIITIKREDIHSTALVHSLYYATYL